MAAVSLRGVRKTYAGSVAVLHGIDLEVHDGEFLVFVGPSGCGKSTLLRCIAGLEDVTGGEIAIGGRAVQDVAPAERGVAMVFQSYALYPHMTVAQNLGFGLKMAGAPRSEVERQVAEVAEVLQLGPLLQRKPGALSGGQRQRVAIGRAIVRRPQVFLFDEPLSNLDASLRVQMRLELARLHQRLGTTMVYVTHDQVEAMTLGQRIAVFNAGRLEQVGTPLELFERPANRFVAGFLGSPRMNFLPVRPLPDGATPTAPEHTRLAVGDGTLLVDRRVTAEGELGVRPEDLQVMPPDQGLPATVDLVEHLGDVIVAHASVPGLAHPLSLKQAPSGPRLRAGDRIGLQPLPGRVHLFDAAGRAV